MLGSSASRFLGLIYGPFFGPAHAEGEPQMPQSLSNILVHIIFSTKERFPFLKDPAVRAQLHSYMAGILIDENCPGLLVGGAHDHTHILSQLGRTSCVADLVKNTKRSSSIWVKDLDPSLHQFGWQKGYGAFRSGSRRWSRSKTTSGVRIDIIDAFRSKTSSGNFFAGIKSISMNGACRTN